MMIRTLHNSPAGTRDRVRRVSMAWCLLPRAAFTFVEVLFAIIILGIGMIMLAAMLPVAISQTAQARDQIAGKAAAETGYAYIKTIARTSGEKAFLATGTAANRAGLMQPISSVALTQLLTPPGLNQYKLSRVISSDPSVQWVPFYRRDPGSNLVKFIILSTRITGNDAVKQYDAQTLAKETTLNNTADANPTIQINGPHLYAVRVVEGKDEPDRLQFYDESNKNNAVDPPMAAPGAYVIIREQNSDDAATADPQVSFRNNGRVFRLASKAEGLVGVWDLSADFDLQPIGLGPDGVNGTPDDLTDYTLDPGGTYSNAPNEWNSTGTNDRATAWIIGKAATDPTGSSGVSTFTGVAQDIGLLQVEIEVE